ncbi:MAG: FeoA domain-containing protein [Candidatus Aegiribacteria sp.]
MRNRRGRKRGGERNSRGPGSVRSGYPLTIASSDEWVRVMSITTDHAAESRLVSMGINPGALLRVISASGSGPIVVARDETRFGIDRKTAWHVRVVPASPNTGSVPYPPVCDDDCRGCSYRTEMMKADYGESVTLDSLETGEEGRVISVRGRGHTVTRLLKLGFAGDAVVRMVRKKTEPDRLLVEVGGNEVEISGWDALHVILEVVR